MPVKYWHIPLVCQQDSVTLVNPGALASGNEFSRQLILTVAQLFLTQAGGQHIVHVELTAQASVRPCGGYLRRLRRSITQKFNFFEKSNFIAPLYRCRIVKR
jgi:hypothetical protein